MSIKIEVKSPGEKPTTHEFETVPRVGEKIEVDDTRWQVAEIVHYKKGSAFEVGVIVLPIYESA